MFTGIIENIAIIRQIKPAQNNLTLVLESALASEFYIDQSIAHNGACLTVTKIYPPFYEVTLIEETLKKTHFSDIKINDAINIERSMTLHKRLDGHFVSGHIDCIGTVTEINDKKGSWEFVIHHPHSPDFITIPKGSITVNGISLTVVESAAEYFSVHIIPYTFENTNISHLKKGDKVNLEFDLLGKYVAKLLSVRHYYK